MSVSRTPAPTRPGPSGIVAGCATAHSGPMSISRKPSRPAGRRGLVLPAVVGVVLVGVLVAGLAVLWGAPSDDERYLATLEQRDLGDEFRGDEDAVRSARQRCDELAASGRTAGTEAERLGVEHLCPERADGFRVLDRHEFDGALLVMSLREGSVDTTGESCVGTDGYEDVNPDTPVVVTGPEGEELARTTLGPGEALDEDSCVFGFTVELTEGAGRYEVVLGERGGRTLDWEELHNRHALSFVLGGVD